MRRGAGCGTAATRRQQLVVDMVTQVQQMRALLECVWTASLDTAKHPFRSTTWAEAMTVVCHRDGGDLARTRRLGAAAVDHAVRREISKRGGQKPCGRIIRYQFTAARRHRRTCTDRGALVRVSFLLHDWQHAS